MILTAVKSKRPSPVDLSVVFGRIAKNGRGDGQHILGRRSLILNWRLLEMNDESKPYIATPRTAHRAERIDSILEKRMREFLLRRRQRLWQERGV